ncbi:hypothetical protein GN958_ATG21954 [Phytophthora infestans]|uniref:Uncharacterized protein n=1 Tax=Phytophthora infestans TaxID=4787 RepID=A0A8S9TPK6_PHYIN|nr:hypothetical protein GN958_ATG21954 [Phytophthora infestans]
MKDIANERRQMIEWTRITTISVRLRAVGLQLPTKEYSLTCAANDGAVYLLNQPLQKTLSRFVRQTRPTLPEFVKMIRSQTTEDYCTNKHMSPVIIEKECAGYPQIQRL